MYQKTLLDNGIAVVTEQLPARTISLGIWVNAGSRDEGPGQSGCAHYVEHMLFKGTAGVRADEIAQEFDRLGGMSNAFTSKEATCLYASILDSQLPQLFNLLADILLHSLFEEQEVERERLVILQEVGMVEDTPEDLIHDLLAALLWGDHSLSRPVLGDPAVIRTMTRKKLLDFVASFYCANRLLIAAAGNIDHQELVALAARAFSAVPPARPAAVLPASRLVPVSRPPKVVGYKKKLEQVHLLAGGYGLPTGAPERYALALLNILLGGNMSSRLFQEVREKRGLAYSIYSFVDSLSDSGTIGIYAGVAPESLSEVMDLIQANLQAICKNGITEKELRHACDYARAGMYLAAESMEARMMRLVKNELSFGRYVSMDEVDQALNRVQLDEVLTVADQLFAKPLSAVLLGPISRQLCGLAYEVVGDD